MLVALPKEAIDKIFSDNGPEDGIVELFKAVIPNWDSLAKINHYPQVNRKTSEYIASQIKLSNKIHNKNKNLVNVWMIWMNVGFGCIEEDIPEWFVKVDESKLVYKEG
jgi:hypothetical protein